MDFKLKVTIGLWTIIGLAILLGPNETQSNFAIAIHGGAGTITRENMTAEKELAYRFKLAEALNTGYTILKNGGTSLDAVEVTIRVMVPAPP